MIRISSDDHVHLLHHLLLDGLSLRGLADRSVELGPLRAVVGPSGPVLRAAATRRGRRESALGQLIK